MSRYGNFHSKAVAEFFQLQKRFWAKKKIYIMREEIYMGIMYPSNFFESFNIGIVLVNYVL